MAPDVQNISLPGAGGVFLERDKREFEMPAQSEMTACQEVAAATSRGLGGVTRDDATTSRGKLEGGARRGNMTTRWPVQRWWRVKRLRCDEKPRDNQPVKWEVSCPWK